MIIACFEGLLYFGVVFTFAFATGAARVLVFAPRLGVAVSVFLEVPILIAASWIVARYLLRNQSFSIAQRVVMGVTAFTLTMASEAALAYMMRGESITDWAWAVATPLGLVGLAGQIAFGAMPIFVGRSRLGLSPRG